MKTINYFLLFFIILSFNFVSAVTINQGVVLNTTSSNSSVTFSFDVNASNFTIEPTYILLYGVNFTNSTGTYTCDVNHSTPNSNLDSAQFCPGEQRAAQEPSLGGGGGTAAVTSIIEVEEIECSQDSDCELNQYCFENKCRDAECFNNNDCKEDESCWNYRCVKWFDMEILEFESPVKIGEFFDFTYFIKAVAEIKGDVEIKFWIERDGNTITSGQDTIYFSSFEEKTKTKKLFLPENISSGTYIFYIEVTYGTYTASAHRTIGITVDGDLATIKVSPKIKDFAIYIICSLTGLALLTLFFICYFERKKIKTELIKEKKWIKKHRFLILALLFLLFIVLGILTYLSWIV